LLELSPADGTVLQQVFTAAINSRDSGSAANEVSYTVLGTDGEKFSKRILIADDLEIEKVSSGHACVTGETGLFDVKHSSSVEIQSNVECEVDHSVAPAACDKSSCAKRHEPPETLMDGAQPGLLRTRRKSTIYGTCKTNIQTEMYR
jgi:hypothetical protein